MSKGKITVPRKIRRAPIVWAKSPFEKYRGIGTPGIRRGRKAVVRWVRELRGR
jgi:hypothetical protein